MRVPLDQTSALPRRLAGTPVEFRQEAGPPLVEVVPKDQFGESGMFSKVIVFVTTFQATQ